MTKKLLLFVSILFIVVGALVAWNVKQMISGSSIIHNYVLFVPSDGIYTGVIDSLSSCDCLKDMDQFQQVAEWKKYPDLVKPGRYELTEGMSNEEVINKLRIGEQNSVTITFNNVRTIDQLAGKISIYLEEDSAAFSRVLTNDQIVRKYGFTKAQFPAMFVPNSYQFNWNTSPIDFVGRMAKEFKRFWTEERLSKAKRLNLSQSEVVTLASIVEEETKKNDEKQKVAGVYINRLRRGMPLQADPTLKFALGDFTVKRILNEDKRIDSPYNTYRYKGLPPGPIRIPEISSIDAVLNYTQHKYLYFCAKEDFSGYHNFATNHRDHIRNAQKYRNALNNRKIYR